LHAEDAINDWQQWDASPASKPVILGSLGGGRSNRSFLLNSDIGKLVLRLNATDSLLPGATRNHESQIWRAASHQGIAPALLHIDEQQRYLVSTYIHNDLPVETALRPGLHEQIFGLLKRCHQLKVEAPHIDYARHVETYWRNIENKGPLNNHVLNEQREPMQILLETLTASNPDTGLCHHDLVPENFVGTAERLYLIDWEYAASGFLVMDYAAIGIEWNTDDATIIRHTGIEQELLVSAKMLYRYICDLWEEQKKPRG